MKFLKSKIKDKINKFYETGEVQNTNFLDPAEVIEAKEIIKDIEYTVFGGYDGAERNIIFIGFEDITNESFNNSTVSVISAFRIVSNQKLSHRAVLGSILSLGVKREMIGDILIDDKTCDIIIFSSIGEFLLNNTKYIGHEKVTTSIHEISKLIQPESNDKEIKTTVNSLRLDSIVSAAYGISREESSKFVKNELVKVNFKEIKNPSIKIKEKDIISVRGKGRFVLEEVIGVSKSDRIKIRILRKQ